MKVYEGIAAAVQAEGCGAVFAVMGDGNMELIVALAERGVPVYNARHEAAAVAMADGYSRATGRVGVATVTHGPGLTQTGTSLMVANRNRSPVVLIAGDTASPDPKGIQDFPQQPFIEASGAHFAPLSTSDDAAEQVRDAFIAARAGRPVVFNAPIDIQKQDHEWAWNYTASTEYVAPRQLLAPDSDRIARVAEMLMSAQRPIIVAGRGAVRSGARDVLVELADRVGSLLATTLLAKGMFYGHEFDIGVVGSLSSAAAERIAKDADLVVAFGASLNYYTTEAGYVFGDAEIVRVDIDTVPRYPAVVRSLHVQADAGVAAETLNRLLAARPDPPKSTFRSESTGAVLDATYVRDDDVTPTDGLDPRSVVALVDELLPDGAIVVCGLGHFWTFPAMYLHPRDVSDCFFVHQFGAIGQTLPIAIGVAIGSGRRVLMFEGDGSLMMHVQELDTAARYGVDLTSVIFNDQGFGAEYHKLRAHEMDESLAAIPTPDLSALGRAFGCQGGALVRTEEELRSALTAAFESPGTAVIDARVSRQILSDPYRRLHFGIASTAPVLRPGR